MRLNEQNSNKSGRSPHALRQLFAFFALACGLTWVLAAPVSLAWMRHLAPSPSAMACAGLSAFGPLVAALLIAGRQKQLRNVFGHWQSNPAWIVLALFTPMMIHVIATALSMATGRAPGEWLHPPSTPERVAALLVFPVGEEFGWRGFAYPRLVERYGLVKGSLVLGALWGVWHLMYSIPPDTGHFDGVLFGMTVAELLLYSLLIAWVFERAQRSMAVAIAFHAGSHLDRLENVPFADFRLHAMHLAVVATLAIVAARSLVNAERRSKRHRLAI